MNDRNNGPEFQFVHVQQSLALSHEDEEEAVWVVVVAVHLVLLWRGWVERQLCCFNVRRFRCLDQNVRVAV